MLKMAKKKISDDIAFKPLVDFKQNQGEIEKIDNSELANYKERGVEFQGFSKTKIADKQYKLLRQEFGSKQNVFGWAASSSSLTLTVNDLFETKDFYITNLEISATTDKDCFFLLAELGGNLLNLHLASAADPNNNLLNLNFKVPFPFKKRTLEIQPLDLMTGAPIAITGNVIINYYGYFEQKS